ncbi:hypothetical protein C9J85_18005 [Haloferax sp. wsp5]|nr:hypothetical protein C9J85_18005 [Haloferax sp. wsp5]
MVREAITSRTRRKFIKSAGVAGTVALESPDGMPSFLLIDQLTDELMADEHIRATSEEKRATSPLAARGNRTAPRRRDLTSATSHRTTHSNR